MRTAASTLLGLLLFAPGLSAQAKILGGGGLTSPLGGFGDVAESGWHIMAGVQVQIPTLPVGLRLDGSHHRMGAATSAYDGSNVTAGALDVVFDLPGVGLAPYILGGVGRFRFDSGLAGASEPILDNGFQIGFGIDLGSIGFGSFAEIRYVQIQHDNASTKYLPLTIGLRL